MRHRDISDCTIAAHSVHEIPGSNTKSFTEKYSSTWFLVGSNLVHAKSVVKSLGSRCYCCPYPRSFRSKRRSHITKIAAVLFLPVTYSHAPCGISYMTCTTVRGRRSSVLLGGTKSTVQRYRALALHKGRLPLSFYRPKDGKEDLDPCAYSIRNS